MEAGQKNRVGNWQIVFVSFVLGISLLLGIGVIAYGFWDGWLLPYWENMTDAQGSVIAGALTIFAAAFAGVFAPLLFQGVIKDVRGEVEKTLSEVNSLAQSTKAAFHTLNDTALSQAGVKAIYSAEDLSRSREILRVIQAKSAEFATRAKEESRKWKKKEEFKGKWPTRQNYIDLLHHHEMIDDDQKAHFYRVLDSRKYTHNESSGDIDLIELNKVAAAFNALKEAFDDAD